MRKIIAFGFGLLSVCITGVGGARVFAATPTFTISAANVTMPAAGNGPIPFTLISVDSYSGKVGFSCSATNPPAGAKLPTCIGSNVISLAANQTVNSECVLIPPGGVIPPSTANLLHPLYGGLGVVLAGALLFGFRIGQMERYRLALVLLAMGTAVGLAGIAGCGDSGNPMTPGTYAYTISGTDSNGLSANTTVNVTIP